MMDRKLHTQFSFYFDISILSAVVIPKVAHFYRTALNVCQMRAV